MYVDDQTRIRHMLDAARKVRENAEGKALEDLKADENLAIVLAHWVQVIGEASRLVSIDLKHLHPEVPWSQIQGMRHRIVHDYTAIRYDLLWSTASSDMRSLIPQLEDILAGLGGGC